MVQKKLFNTSIKLIVAGSRSIKDFDLVSSLIEQTIKTAQLEVSYIISGCARGVDKLAERWALENNVPVMQCPAQWSDISDPKAQIKYNQQGKPYNKLAGLWRNEKMAELGDAVLIIHDGKSTGSTHMKKIAQDKNIPVFYHVVDLPRYTENNTVKFATEISEWASNIISNETDVVVIDTESCGGNKTDEIISLAAVRLHDGKQLFNSLLKPSKDVKFNWHATQVHGITKQMLRNQPSLSDVWDEVYELLNNKRVLAFNHVADKRMLLQTLDKQGLEHPNIYWECIMKAYKQYRGGGPINLTAACTEMDVTPGTHDAMDDAIAAARLMHRIARKYKFSLFHPDTHE